MRGFLSGVIWGGVVSVLSLGVVSQLMQAPATAPVAAANSPDAPVPETPVPEAAVPEAAVPEAALPEASKPEMDVPAPVADAPATEGDIAAETEAAASEVAAAPPVTETSPPDAAVSQVPEAGMADAAGSEDTPIADAPAAPDTPSPETPSPDTSATASAGELPSAAPADTATAPAAQADAPQADLAQLDPLPDAPVPQDDPASPATDPSPAEAAPPVQPEAINPGPAMPSSDAVAEGEPDLEPLPGEVPAHSPLAPEPAPEPEVAVEPAAPSEPLLDRPAAEAETTPGTNGAEVTTNRLPRIEPAPAAPVDPAEEVAVQDDRPLARFKAPFENPSNKPLYAILLIDDGKTEIDRAGLASLSVPVTIVIDPAAPDAAKLQALYRAAGKEVAMLASGIPKGAKASDLQVTFEAHSTTLPEAVAVVDLPQEGFQNNRLLAADVLPLLKDQGRGLVTFDRGSNAGDQLARREAVPSAVIFRELDAGGEAAPLIRRYLDRAAFKAAQDGRVAVLGHATPETLTAVLEWSLEGRAGSVALAPLTAVMSQPE